jgi:hypothetical protein
MGFTFKGGANHTDARRGYPNKSFTIRDIDEQSFTGLQIMTQVMSCH